MTDMRMLNGLAMSGVAILLAAGLMTSGCGKGDSGGTAATSVIQVKGSDTMVNVAQAWAEDYKKVAPAVEVEVSGGGSGQGIAALIKGTIDIANCSRNMKPQEIEQAKKNTGKGRPTHERLLANVAAIRRASLQSIWTDDDDRFPSEGEAIWWEAWLRARCARD